MSIILGGVTKKTYIGIANAMTIRLWAYLFNMLWGVKTNLDIEINGNERCMAKNPQQAIFLLAADFLLILSTN